MSEVYVLIWDDLDGHINIYEIHKTKQSAEEAKKVYDLAYRVKNPLSGFEIKEYELHELPCNYDGINGERG